jgi:nickel-dependent lactate racemase
MELKFLYGRQGLKVELPDNRTTVVKTTPVEGLTNDRDAILEALKNPIGSPTLRDLVDVSDTVAIVFSDITRPMPSDRVLPILLDELKEIPKDQIVFINALGTHRKNTQEELVEILGSEIYGSYRIIQHDSYDVDSLVHLGRSSRGNEIYINRTYMESSVKILTGFIKPHLFAGFSGGPKAVLPGIAGAKTVFDNHGPEMIGDPGVGFGRTTGNPIWEEMLEVAKATKPTFLLNITTTEDHQITGVFAGDLEQAHRAGIDFLKQSAFVPVEESYDIVVTSVGGYPMDMSAYQSVKGIGLASNITKDGGTIILVSGCMEGLPEHGEYGELTRISNTPKDLLTFVHKSGQMMQDQWDAQIQAQICLNKDLYIYSDGLSDDEIRQVFGKPCRSVENTVAQLLSNYGPEARIAALPEGTYMVPMVRAMS